MKRLWQEVMTKSHAFTLWLRIPFLGMYPKNQLKEAWKRVHSTICNSKDQKLPRQPATADKPDELWHLHHEGDHTVTKGRFSSSRFIWISALEQFLESISKWKYKTEKSMYNWLPCIPDREWETCTYYIHIFIYMLTQFF